MLTAVGVIVFVLAILASIALHELGHLVPAKRFGVKVTQYFVGFGPTLWSTRRGETEYGVKGIPFGGYVRMVGMLPPGKDGKDRVGSTGRIGMLVESARKESEADIVTDDDRERAFYRLSPGKKIVVMAGGPLVNLVLALVLFTIMFVGFGTPGPSLTVASVSECLPTSVSDTGECPAGAEPSGASAAGIRPGDELVSVDGTRVDSWDGFTAALLAAGPGATTVTIVRDGTEQTLPVNLTMVERPVIVEGRDTGQTQQRPFLGVGPQFGLEPLAITAVPGEVWDLTVRSAQALVSFPAKLVGVGEAAFGNAERDPEGPIGMVGASRISGEVAGGDLPGSWKIAQLIGIIASVNLFLFLFNMIPLLPLDGGHIAGALYEGGRRKVATWRGKPDPGPADVAKLLPIAYGVALVLVVVSVLLIYADVVAPVRLG